MYQDLSSGGTFSDDTAPVWSNAEVLTLDGSVYLAASEPVPVGGIGGNDDFTKGYLVGAELRRRRY